LQETEIKWEAAKETQKQTESIVELTAKKEEMIWVLQVVQTCRMSSKTKSWQAKPMEELWGEV